jgi:hypothetical protein
MLSMALIRRLTGFGKKFVGLLAEAFRLTGGATRMGLALRKTVILYATLI